MKDKIRDFGVFRLQLTKNMLGDRMIFIDLFGSSEQCITECNDSGLEHTAEKFDAAAKFLRAQKVWHPSLVEKKKKLKSKK